MCQLKSISMTSTDIQWNVVAWHNGRNRKNLCIKDRFNADPNEDLHILTIHYEPLKRGQPLYKGQGAKVSIILQQATLEHLGTNK